MMAHKALRPKISAQFGRTDGSPEDYLDFSASAWNAEKGVYEDAIDGVIWLTGAGIDIVAGERDVAPVCPSMGNRWVEHTVEVSDPIVGAQIMVRLKVPGLPKEITRVATSIGDVSGTSKHQLNTEDVNIVLYRR